jgi:hypothetical protein
MVPVALAIGHRLLPLGLHPGNSQCVDISDFGAHGHLPPGVALLLAAVLEMLAVIEALGREMQ